MSAEERKDWTPRDAEPYQEGNTAALKHGTFSEQVLRTDTTEIIERALEIVPWLSRPEFRATLRSWARSEAIASRAFAALVKDGVLDVEKRSHLFERWRSAENTARSLRADLGLDPQSRMKLEADFFHVERERALTEAMEEGRRLRLEAEARSASETTEEEES